MFTQDFKHATWARPRAGNRRLQGTTFNIQKGTEYRIADGRVDTAPVVTRRHVFGGVLLLVVHLSCAWGPRREAHTVGAPMLPGGGDDIRYTHQQYSADKLCSRYLTGVRWAVRFAPRNVRALYNKTNSIRDDDMSTYRSYLRIVGRRAMMHATYAWCWRCPTSARCRALYWGTARPCGRTPVKGGHSGGGVRHSKGARGNGTKTHERSIDNNAIIFTEITAPPPALSSSCRNSSAPNYRCRHRTLQGRYHIRPYAHYNGKRYSQGYGRVGHLPGPRRTGWRAGRGTRPWPCCGRSVAPRGPP